MDTVRPFHRVRCEPLPVLARWCLPILALCMSGGTLDKRKAEKWDSFALHSTESLLGHSSLFHLLNAQASKVLALLCGLTSRNSIRFGGCGCDSPG